MFEKQDEKAAPSKRTKTSQPVWLEQALDNPRWGIPIVKLAIADKKERRNLRGLEFNCFVLNKPVNKDENNEFVNFLTELQKNSKTFTGSTRFQVALFSEDNHHWTAFDFLIVDGKLHVFCLDAANDSSADVALDEIISRFPGCNAYRLEPDRDPKGTNSRHLRIIQTDRESCSRMTIEHIFLLSKRNFLFHEQFKEFRLVNGVKLISPDTLFRQAPDLYRVTQVRSIFESLANASPKEAQKLVSKKGLNIMDYTRLHGQDKEQPKISRNKTIDYKRENIESQLEHFVMQYGEERIESLLTSSEQQWSDFLKMPYAKKVEFLLGEIKDKPFPEIVHNILTKNINDRHEHIKYIEDHVIKKSTSFFKGVDQYFEKRNLKKEIKKLEEAVELIQKLADDVPPDEVISSWKKLKLPITVLNELKTAHHIYSKIDMGGDEPFNILNPLH